MVLTLKRWKSRSSPGITAGALWKTHSRFQKMPLPVIPRGGVFVSGAGWSSPVARQAHNLKVAGSNPAPATSKSPRSGGVFLLAPGRLRIGGLPDRAGGAEKSHAELQIADRSRFQITARPWFAACSLTLLVKPLRNLLDHHYPVAPGIGGACPERRLVRSEAPVAGRAIG